jgi:hypothetical protein
MRIGVSGEEFAYGKSFSVTFSGVHYQNSIALISASAEVVSEYSQYIRAKSAARVVFCIGCADDTFGYIPTSTMISQGGYEAGGYCKTFSLLSLNPQIELNTKNALERVFNI